MKRVSRTEACVLIFLLMLVFLSSFSCSRINVILPRRETADESISLWPMVTVSGAVVNLRGGPGTQYAVLGQVEYGAALLVTGALDDWYRVHVANLSLFAWIYAPLTSGIKFDAREP